VPQPIKDLALLRRHTTGGPLHPIGVVLTGDALLDRQPRDLVHGAALALGLPAQEGGLFVGEPEGHRHGRHDTIVLPPARFGVETFSCGSRTRPPGA
jgi:hypothetical protein